jgi:hypothetical protein
MTGLGTIGKNYDGMQSQSLMTDSIPPPVGGLNRRDALAAMSQLDAVTLNNLFAQPSWIEVRRGHASHATGMGASNTIETLMEWAGPSSHKLKAAVNGNVYDVTSAGAVGAAEVTGLSENDWQWLNFGTSGGNFLVACNGTDAVRNYDGSSWTSPAITGSGLTSSDLINVAVWKNRLWFVEKNTLNAWYLPVNSIAGAATKQSLAAQASLGGSLVAIGTISRGDAGDGADDYIAFITSEGQVVVYQGTDPSSAVTYGLVGVFRTGYPIGRRCFINVGGDLGIINSDGIISVAQLMSNGREAAQRGSISDKIQLLFNQYVRDYGSNPGWQAVVYPKSNMLVINVPVSTTQYNQLVMNTKTGAWCQFTGLNGFCFGLLNNDLYFGSTVGVVYKADTGYQDNGGIITANVLTSWNYFKTKGSQKLITMARPIIETDGSPAMQFIIHADFNVVAPTGSISSSAPMNSLWGSALWGEGVWGGESALINQWVSGLGLGTALAVNMAITTNGASVRINSIDVAGPRGGVL